MFRAEQTSPVFSVYTCSYIFIRIVNISMLSRWLLHCQYHTGKDLVNLTHEILAMMLGTSRTLVTTTACKLQQAGTISYKQGQMKILDRMLLESLSCECHKIVKDNFAKSLGL